MSRPRKKHSLIEDFHVTIYCRSNHIYYYRIVHNESKAVIVERSTGENNLNKASLTAGAAFSQMEDELPILYRHYQEKHSSEKEQSSNSIYTTFELKRMKAGEYFIAFWDEERSPYLYDKKNANKAISKKTIVDNTRYMKEVDKDPILHTLLLKNLLYEDIETFFRGIRDQKSPYVLLHTRNAMRRAINWGSTRHICKNITFKELQLPTIPDTERGILTEEEVTKVLALETIPLWTSANGNLHPERKPRPRLPKRKKNPITTSNVYFQEKLYVILGLATAARRGELRALTWKNIDFDQHLITIDSNYVDTDGFKDPKGKSKGTLPLIPELEAILKEAWELAKVIGTDKPDGYVLVNSFDFSKPVSDNIDEAWPRVLRAIGISDEERKARHLVFHGTRHHMATILLDSGMSLHAVMGVLRHRAERMTTHYGDHVSPETLEKAMGIMRPDKNTKEQN